MSLHAAKSGLLARALRRLGFRLHGHRAGLGQPVPAAALDKEYASGAWDHFFGPDELPRHEILMELIRSARPRPRLLDLGCGSGRLASLLDPASLDDYLGVDVSEEGLRRARALARPAPLDRFEHHDFEAWTPSPDRFDVITFNECPPHRPPLRRAAPSRRRADRLPLPLHQPRRVLAPPLPPVRLSRRTRGH
jgi:SAM-dependent methyltransferase